MKCGPAFVIAKMRATLWFEIRYLCDIPFYGKGENNLTRVITLKKCQVRSHEIELDECQNLHDQMEN